MKLLLGDAGENMKKIRYRISNNTVFAEVYDTELEMVMNFTSLYKGKNKEQCEAWLKRHKKKVKKR